MVTQLTCSSNCVSDIGRMPSSDTSDSSPTSMGLLLEMLDTVSLDDSTHSLTLGDSDDVDLLVLLEHLVHIDGLLQQVTSIVNLLVHLASIHLDLEDVVLLLSQIQLVHLSVHNHTNHSAVLLYSVQLQLLILGILGSLLRVLSECLLLRVHPVLVEPSQSVLSQLRGPNSSQRSQSSWGLNVPNNTNHYQRGSLNNSHGLNSLLAV